MIKEPKINMPVESDFYYDGGADEQWALKTYLGKDLNFASQQFYQLDPLSKVHDFELVGIRAFNYYIIAAFRYLQSEKSKGEPDVYSALAGILIRRSEENTEEIAKYVHEFSEWALRNYTRFKVAPEIYGDAKGNWKKVRSIYAKKCNA